MKGERLVITAVVVMAVMVMLVFSGMDDKT